MIVNAPPSVRYALDVIRDEVYRLVRQGVLGRCQRIYTLLEHFPACEWACLEYELEASGFLLRDRIADLLPHEEWQND